MSALIRFQERILGIIRPAQWLGVFHEQNRASIVLVLRSDFTLEAIQTALSNAAERHGHYQVFFPSFSEESRPLVNLSAVSADSEPLTIEPVFFTTKIGWLDVVDFELEYRDETSNFLTITSSSTSWVPATIPLAPILGALFFWIVFFDHGANLRHLYLIHHDLQQFSGQKIFKKTINDGKIMRPVEYVFVISLFGLTVLGTLLNIFFNHYLILNIIVTIICAALTINTFLTLFCGILIGRPDPADSPEIQNQS